jgi:hypothetical protein
MTGPQGWAFQTNHSFKLLREWSNLILCFSHLCLSQKIDSMAGVVDLTQQIISFRTRYTGGKTVAAQGA